MRDHVQHIRRLLVDPRGLCGKLGWLEGSKNQARGVIIRCPSHGERDPSCSVSLAPDGLVRVKCFACDFSGDALTLVALSRGLDTRRDFTEVLASAAEVAGDLALASELRGERVPGDAIARPQPVAPALSTIPLPKFPSTDSVASLWRSCGPVDIDGLTVKMMMGRGLNFEAIAHLGLCRSMSSGSGLPRWARYHGRSWWDTGHRLVLPAFDHRGQMRSVRAWRVLDNDTPKRLPPGGCKGSGLVQSNRPAVMMLRRLWCPRSLYITEGEPDFLTAATTWPDDAVIGIGSGSWSEEFARRIPQKTHVFVSTHADRAGDKYADEILGTLGNKCPAWRWRMSA